MNGHVNFRTRVDSGRRRSSGAVARDVTFGSARVARALLRLRAVPRDMTRAVAVVAFGSLDAVARQVAYTTARVASLCAASSAAAAAAKASTASASAAASTARRGVGASTGNVAGLSAAVALGTGKTAAATSASASARVVGVGTVTRNVPLLAALVARLGLGLTGAVTRQMTLLTTIVASGTASLGTVGGLMAECTAIVTAAIRHFFGVGSVQNRRQERNGD